MNLKTVPCRGCGKPIIWGTTKDGKRIPLDPRAPVYVVNALEYPPAPEDLEIVHIERGNGKEPPSTAFRWAKGNGAVVFAAYVSHFATCPKASDFSQHTRRTP